MLNPEPGFFQAKVCPIFQSGIFLQILVQANCPVIQKDSVEKWEFDSFHILFGSKKMGQRKACSLTLVVNESNELKKGKCFFEKRLVAT